MRRGGGLAPTPQCEHQVQCRAAFEVVVLGCFVIDPVSIHPVSIRIQLAAATGFESGTGRLWLFKEMESETYICFPP